MTGWLRSFQILAVSSFTGCILGGCVSGCTAALAGASLTSALAYGAPAGALIGVATAGAFLGLSLNAGRRPIASFAAVGPIVGLGASAANLVAGLRPGAVFFATVFLSVAIGYLATAFWFRSYRRWNDQLQAYRRLADDQNAGDNRDR